MNRKSSPEVLQILIVDDHAVVREGLKRILESCGEPWAVCEASGGLQALELVRTRRIDLAIVDLSMPGMSGLELIQHLRAEFGSIGVLVFSMHAEEQYALRAFQCGANGYVTKDSGADEAIEAVRRVIGGGSYVTPGLAERVVMQLKTHSDTRDPAVLSSRELDVLRRIVSGQRLTDIAQALNLSIKTVSTHKTRIQDKLHLPTMAGLIRYGMDHGLVVEPERLAVSPVSAPPM